MTDTTSNTSDRVFANPEQHIVDFEFNDKVVAVFPDMIRRSVPGYEFVIAMTGLFANQQVGENGKIYDLGCSLGATTLSILQRLEARTYEVVAVDNSKAMIEKASRLCTDPRVRWLQQDIQATNIMGADFVAMNYTLQFIPVDERLALLTQIRQGLTDGGALIVSEKIELEDEAEQAFVNTTHLNFKRANGYSDLEVSQKRTALENVMHPEALTTHLTRLKAAGFSKCTIWYQCLNWASIVAFP